MSGIRGKGERSTVGDPCAAELTRQLLAFSRQQVLQPKGIDLNDSVSKMDEIFRRVLDEGVAFLQKPIPSDALVRAVRQALDPSAGSR